MPGPVHSSTPLSRSGSPGLYLRRGLEILVLLLPVIWIEVLWLASGADFNRPVLLTRLLLIGVVLLTSLVAKSSRSEAGHLVLPWIGGITLVCGLTAVAIYVSSSSTLVAWIGLGAWLILGLILHDLLAAGLDVIGRAMLLVLMALAVGGMPVAIAQWEARFSEEEFFAALQIAALCSIYLLLRSGQVVLWRTVPRKQQARLPLRGRWVLLAALGLGGMALLGLGRAYQQSFYPGEAPAYPGITNADPFACGQVRPDHQRYDGQHVFLRLLRRVEANPLKGPPEYGMLALAYQDVRWARAFREQLLLEVEQGRFTEPAQSVKVGQLHAAYRAYYYPRVRDAFPNLFNPGEQARVHGWFAAINRRALTVEWVDWMYALAFATIPEGPYQNQENGAGLLALLETANLSAPELSVANRDYLRRFQRGWQTRFRNTDDAVIYHPEWISNAYFQSLYTGKVPAEHMRLAFEWLLLQAKPDGSRLRYNHPYQGSFAGIAYLGARLTGDPRFIWQAGRALDDLEARDEYLYAQPGVEEAVALIGASPDDGTCLLYGDSGLPTQLGPLAPDKIVFRDGWAKDSTYALLNLRFTGWHRYKASNTVVLVHKQEPLSAELLEGKPTWWLPEGRSVFRDKRVPRENLNGLIVERTGLSRVLYLLTGMGGPWAQDPPFYASVEHFETSTERDWSRTTLRDWHGWNHQRDTILYHGGPLVVVDKARGSGGPDAALVWHLLGRQETGTQRIKLGASDQAAELVLLPSGKGQIQVAPELEGQTPPRLEVMYRPAGDEQIELISVFLFDGLVGADVRPEQQNGRTVLQLQQGARRMVLPLP